MKEKGIAPIVIIVVIAVVATAAVGGYLVGSGGLGGGGKENEESTSSGGGGEESELSGGGTLEVSASVGSGNNVKLTITHHGGDALPLQDLKLIVSKSGGSFTDKKLSDLVGVSTLTVGESITAPYDYGADPEGESITVKIVHTPSDQLVYDMSNIYVSS